MKRKNLFLMFGLGAALMLTACSQNDEVTNGGNGSESLAVFSSGAPDATRTSMDENGAFYWTSGDRIFVKNGSTYVKSNNAASSKQARENFYLTGTFDADSYPIVYTGNGNATTATSVTIKAAQSQPTANDATHIGTDGDCGNATARKTGTGTYTFDLVHRASYLIITPRHSLSGDVKLTKVEVSTSGSDNLCGTYSFSENTASLKNEMNTGSGDLKKVTLTTGTWTIPTVEEALTTDTKLNGVRGFMVIQPGTHELTFTYHVTVDGTVRTFIKTVSSRNFNAGNFTNVKHILADGMFNGGHTAADSDAAGEINDDPVAFDLSAIDYYQWGATRTYLYTYLTDDYDQTTNAPTQLMMTSPVAWGELPNANELYSYVAYGDPRWDGATVWSTDGGLTEYTGGIWMKKRTAIGSQFSDAIGMDGDDMCSVAKTYTVNTISYATAGKPADSVIDQYFFLPALGYFLKDDYPSGAVRHLGGRGFYWSRSPYPTGPNMAGRAYRLAFDNSAVHVDYYYRRVFGFVVAPGWFK